MTFGQQIGLKSSQEDNSIAVMTKKLRVPPFLYLFLLFSAFSSAHVSSAHAQGVLPDDQPDVQRIVAIVNDQVISVYDLNLRLSLILAATGGINSEEEYITMREDVLSSMVDELLQIQEAQEFELKISDAEIEDSIANLARNNNMSRDDFLGYLSSIGSDISSLIPQIESSMVWQRLVEGRFGGNIQVSDAEIDAVLKHMMDNAGEAEYLVTEIFLTAASISEREALSDLATRLAGQLQGDAPFESLARQFSRATSAATGGDLGWMQEDQMIPAIAEYITGMDIGNVSDPIQANGGYYIIQLRDRRRILAADPMDTELDLIQITMVVSEDATQDEIKGLIDQISETAQGRDGCSDTAGLAGDLGTSTYGEVGSVSLRDLPMDIRVVLEKLALGAASVPFVSAGQMQVLFVCSRVEPVVEPPSIEMIENSLSSQRLAMMSRRYLRDLRQDSIIDYR